MKDLTIVKIMVSRSQTDLSIFGNKLLLLSNDKKEVARHIILCCIRVPLQNNGPRVKELLVDGNLGSDAMAMPFIFWHDINLTIKKFGSETNFTNHTSTSTASYKRILITSIPHNQHFNIVLNNWSQEHEV
jgi:hypothetical protein